jgi:hypothetical protein
MQRIISYEQELARGINSFLLQIGLWVAVVAVALFLTGHMGLIPGFIVGTAVSLIYAFLVGYRIRRSATLPPKEAVAYMRTGWLIRLAFIILVLIWSLKMPQINFPAVVVGLFSLQIVILFQGIYLVAKRFLIK